MISNASRGLSPPELSVSKTLFGLVQRAGSLSRTKKLRLPDITPLPLPVKTRVRGFEGRSLLITDTSKVACVLPAGINTVAGKLKMPLGLAASASKTPPAGAADRMLTVACALELPATPSSSSVRVAVITNGS